MARLGFLLAVPHLVGLVEIPPQILHEKNQVERVGRGFFKAEAKVKRTGVFAHSVNHESTHSRLLRDRPTTKHGVLQQGPSDAFALMPLIDRQAGENHNRNGPIYRLAFQHALRRIGGLDLPNGQPVVANDTFAVLRCHEDPRGANSFGMARATNEPSGEGFVAAVESLQPMLS